MIFSILKFICFLGINFLFGFSCLSQLTKIKSILLLIPLSQIVGIGCFLSLCHLLAYVIGPTNSAYLSLLILFLVFIIFFILKKKELFKVDLDIKKSQILILLSFAILISVLSYLAMSKFGTFDRESHIVISMTMFKNNIYPPRDPFRPDYILLYHYGGDLLAGAVYRICGFDISTSYEIIGAMLGAFTFLSFFALAWLITNSFFVSFITAFCSYFSGGLLWLDAIIRYLLNLSPVSNESWTFLQTFLNLGIHGGILNAPSVLTFISTFNLGNPLTLVSLILFWLMIKDKKFNLFYILFLNLCLLSLYMTTDWLYVTFWGSVLPYLLLMIVLKKEDFKKILLPSSVLLFSSVILCKTFGNVSFLQDPLQNLGRTNVFNIGIKENLFTVVSWGRLTSKVMEHDHISFFSWEFLGEFGLSLILIPIAIIYLFKSKEKLSILLSMSILTIMPIPLIIDFKLNPVELVRLFAFANTMLALLITIGIWVLYKSFFKNKIFLLSYVICFSLSPVCQLLSGVIFSPHVFAGKVIVKNIVESLKNVNSPSDFIVFYNSYREKILSHKNRYYINFKNEMDFLNKNSKPMDVAITNFNEFPAFEGTYCFIPSGVYVYWDQLYSKYNSIHNVVLSTLDPVLINELNIKWLILSEDFIKRLPEETQSLLNNTNIFKQVYSDKRYGTEIKIFHVENFSHNFQNISKKTGWILIDKNGMIFETSILKQNEISIFRNSRSAIYYLAEVLKNNKSLKEHLITIQPVLINEIEEMIKSQNLNIRVVSKN